MKNKTNFIILFCLLSNLQTIFTANPELEKSLKSIELSALEDDYKCALIQLGNLICKHKDFNSYTARIEKVLKGIEASTLSEADKVKAKELFTRVVATTK